MVKFIQEKPPNFADLLEIVLGREEVRLDELILKGFSQKLDVATKEDQLLGLSDINGLEKLSGYALSDRQTRQHERAVLVALLIFICHHRKVFRAEHAAQVLAFLNRPDSLITLDLSNPICLFQPLIQGCEAVPSPGYSKEQVKLFDLNYEVIFFVGICLANFAELESLSSYVLAAFGMYLEAVRSDCRFVDELRSWVHDSPSLGALLTRLENYMFGRNNSKHKHTPEQAKFALFANNLGREVAAAKTALKPYLGVELNHTTKSYYWESDFSQFWRYLASPFQALTNVIQNAYALQIAILNDLVKQTPLDADKPRIEAKILDFQFKAPASNNPYDILLAARQSSDAFVDLLQTVCAISALNIRLREKADLDNPLNKKKKLSFKLGRGSEFFMEHVLGCPKPTAAAEEKPQTGDAPESPLPVPKLEPVAFNPACLSTREKLLELFESRSQEKRTPTVAKGVRDTDPTQMRIKKQAFEIITRIFNEHGAVEIDTPVFELKETLLGKYGEEGGKLIYDLNDQGGQLLSLRYDLTVPFARYLATNNVKKLKRFHIGKVYRRDQPDINKGRYREFYQCDLDIAGSYEPMIPDSEVLCIIDQIMTALDVGNFEIKLCHRVLLEGIVVLSGASLSKFKTICSSIDKLDKEPWDKVAKELTQEKAIDQAVVDRIGVFVQNRGSIDEMIAKFEREQLFAGHAGALKALEELKLLSKYLKLLKAYDHITLDLSLARGLDYYTGVIYEIVIEGAKVGSVGAGGRYDNLVGMFGANEIPCIGLSIGIERIFVLLEEKFKKQRVPVRENETLFLVATIGKGLLEHKLELVGRLWKQGFKAEILYEAAPKPAKQLTFALESGIPFIIWLGEDEVKAGVVKIKVGAGDPVHVLQGREHRQA